MMPKLFPWLVGTISVAIATGFAIATRLPLPFDGFAAVAAALIAGILTLSLVMLAPAHWIWTDAERLRHAFAQRHNMSEQRSENVLDAITGAHARAEVMRTQSTLFAASLKQRTFDVADRLEDIAKDLFYNPDALAVHRQALVRSELIEEAVINHASLRKRGQTDVNAAQIAQSRDRVDAALIALEDAFDHNENRLADRLLRQVDVASATAEMLLKRHSAKS